jgi:hypothetical protein
VRNKIVTTVAAGIVGATTFALAGPALAASTTSSETANAVTSHVDRIRQALAGLVADKTLSQAQADKVASTLDKADIGGGHGRGGFGRGPGLAAAATALKMTESELRTALHGGKTLAQVAKDKNVPVATLVDALVKAEQAHIAQEVKDGRITQARADERLQDLTARVTERVNSTRPSRRDRGGDAPSSSTVTPTTAT